MFFQQQQAAMQILENTAVIAENTAVILENTAVIAENTAVILENTQKKKARNSVGWRKYLGTIS